MYHRILVRKNFLPGSIGYWTETNKTWFDYQTPNLYYDNEYAYPINTIEKPMAINKILNYMENHNIYGLGRWGEHQHYNSDKVVSLALKLSEKILNL